MTVPELCVYTHNFFDRADDPVAGEFAFEPDTVPAGVVPGQYFLVCGSIFNDGVQPMRVPPDFVALAEKIDAYDKALPAGGVYVSQSFAGWSGTMATDTDGLPADGKTRYKSEINQWRKM